MHLLTHHAITQPIDLPLWLLPIDLNNQNVFVQNKTKKTQTIIYPCTKKPNFAHFLTLIFLFFLLFCVCCRQYKFAILESPQCLKEFQNKWYKDEGGRQKYLEFKIGLFNRKDELFALDNDVKYSLHLVYENDKSVVSNQSILVHHPVKNIFPAFALSFFCAFIVCILHFVDLLEIFYFFCFFFCRLNNFVCYLLF